MLILFSIFSDLEFSSENHSSIYENSKLKLSDNIIFLMKYLVIDPLIY